MKSSSLSHSYTKVIFALLVILFIAVAIPLEHVYADDDDDDDNSSVPLAPVAPPADNSGDNSNDPGKNTFPDPQSPAAGDYTTDAGDPQCACVPIQGTWDNPPENIPAVWSVASQSWMGDPNGGGGGGNGGGGGGCGFTCSPPPLPPTPFCAQNPTDSSCVTFPPSCGGFSNCPIPTNPSCVGSNCTYVTPKLCYVYASKSNQASGGGNSGSSGFDARSNSGGATLTGASDSNSGGNGGAGVTSEGNRGGNFSVGASGGGGGSSSGGSGSALYSYWCHPIPKNCVSRPMCNSNGDSIDSCNPSHVIAYASVCSYGFQCSSGTCKAPPAPLVTDFTVHPTLVSSGETTNISWNVSNVGGCTVTGTDGETWTTTSGTQVSKPLKSQTIFTLSCTTITGAENADGSTATWTDQARTVNIVPRFEEK